MSLSKKTFLHKFANKYISLIISFVGFKMLQMYQNKIKKYPFRKENSNLH